MAESVANHHKPFRAGLHSLVVTLRAADESLVSNCGELLAILDNPIRHVRVKLHSEGDKSFFVGWWKIAKPTDQAHQQRPIFNCDHVSPTGKVRCRSGNKYERFSGERFRLCGSSPCCKLCPGRFQFPPARKNRWLQVIAEPCVLGRSHQLPDPPRSNVNLRSVPPQQWRRDKSVR